MLELLSANDPNAGASSMSLSVLFTKYASKLEVMCTFTLLLQDASPDATSLGREMQEVLSLMSNLEIFHAGSDGLVKLTSQANARTLYLKVTALPNSPTT